MEAFMAFVALAACLIGLFMVRLSERVTREAYHAMNDALGVVERSASARPAPKAPEKAERTAPAPVPYMRDEVLRRPWYRRLRPQRQAVRKRGLIPVKYRLPRR